METKNAVIGAGTKVPHLSYVGDTTVGEASNIGAGLTTPDRATDFTDRMDSASAQLVSTLGASTLNVMPSMQMRRQPSSSNGVTPSMTMFGRKRFIGSGVSSRLFRSSSDACDVSRN